MNNIDIHVHIKRMLWLDRLKNSSGGTNMLMYEEYQPANILNPYIKCYWTMKIDDIPNKGKRLLIENSEFTINLAAPVEYIRNNGTAKMMINTCITGPMSQPMSLRSDNTISLFGICFRPGGSYPFFSMPAYRLANQYFETADLLSTTGENLTRFLKDKCHTVESRIETVNDYFLKKLGNTHHDNTVIDSALHIIEHKKGAISIDQLSHCLGISRRHLDREFKERIGISPKQFCENLRFKNAYKSMYSSANKGLSDVAISCGYYDQAHLNNEFKKFVGISPIKYFKADSEMQEFITVNF
jgi:Transcriptional regulator containing an amidase domain and an AraC-type DNA-binding HTH domain